MSSYLVMISVKTNVGASETIVVTGASGFLGSRLVSMAKSRGLDVIAVSSSCDAPDFFKVTSYVDTPCPGGSTLFHLAENPLVSSYDQDPTLVEKNFEIVKALCAKAYAGIVYASSTAVYDSQLGRMKVSNDSPVRNAPYATAKLKCESLIRERGGCVVRLTNLVGRKMSTKSLLWEIASQLLSGEKVQVRNASALLDLLPVDDAAYALLCARGVRAKTISVGSGESMTVKDLVNRLTHLLDLPEQEICSLNIGQAESRVVDMRNLPPDFDWQRKVPIDDAISEAVRGVLSDDYRLNRMTYGAGTLG